MKKVLSEATRRSASPCTIRFDIPVYIGCEAGAELSQLFHHPGFPQKFIKCSKRCSNHSYTYFKYILIYFGFLIFLFCFSMNNCQKCHCFVGVLHSNAHEELFPASSFLTIEDKRIKTSSKTADSILFARSFSHLFPTVFSDMVTQLRSITYLPFLSSLSAAIEGLISKTKGYSFGLFEKPEKSSKLHAEIC